MSSTSIIPPTTTEVAEKTGLQVAGRETVRKTGLSLVERLRLEAGPIRTAILKTTVPEMRHESAVHGFASALEINAAELLAADDGAPFPWLLQEDLGGGRTADEPGLEDVAAVLESLAEFHVRSMSAGGKLWAVPDRSLSWLIEEADGALAIIERAVNETGSLDGDSGSVVTGADAHKRFAKGIELLAGKVSRIPGVVVHGDFDTGNLVNTRGRWRAIDWGLSHRNIPFVDVAHVVGHFSEQDHLPLMQRYLDAAAELGVRVSGGHDPEELLVHGRAALDAFFVWWHSYCVVELGLPVSDYAPRLVSRYVEIGQIAGD